MTDEQHDDSTTEQTEVEGQEPASTEEEAGSAEEQEPTDADGADADEDKDDEGLDPKVKAKMSKLRGEAAGWRTQVRDLQRQLAEAVKPEDLEAVKAQAAEQIKAYERDLVLAKHPLPEELAALLKGDTREELEAHAKALSKFVTPEPSDDDGDLDGGLDPSDRDGSFDPRAEAKRIRARRNRLV